MKKYLLPITLLLTLCLFLAVGCGKKAPGTTEPKTTPEATTPPASTPEAQRVVIAGNGADDYTLVYATGGANGEMVLAMRETLAGYGVSVMPSVDKNTPVGEHEILIGATNRPLSERLMAMLADKCENADDLAWGILYENGSLAIAASSPEAFRRGYAEMLAPYLSSEDFSVPSDLSFVRVMTRAAYEQEIRDREEAELQEKIKEMKAKVASFKTSDFGTSTTLQSPFASPETSPTRGQHPRLLVTDASLAAIRAELSVDESAYGSQEYRSLVEMKFTGILPAVPEDSLNYDARGLGAIEAKAMEYLLTGNQLYGYEAIYAIKNFILTLYIAPGSTNDIYRCFGHTMMVAGIVYDWCYDLLTSADRNQIIAGVENFLCRGKMEVGFPPSEQSFISSHGSEAQLLRDYLSFSVAIYDERPDWWGYVGGRFYAEYLPFRNEFFKSGIAQQGSGLYGPYRHTFDLWSAWIVQVMSGENPYTDDMAKVMVSFVSHELSDGSSFVTGDGSGGQGTMRDYAVSSSLISSALFNNPMLRATAKYHSNDFTRFTYDNNMMTPTQYLILSAMGCETAEDRFEARPLVVQNGYPVSQIIARNVWHTASTEDETKQAAVLMKIGERTTANHDHMEAGTFQIFYRNPLAIDSGCYAGYGTNHHYYYHQATIAHNGLLIYNPNLAETERGWYSGGQRKMSETDSVSEWNGATYETGTVTGEEIGYKNGTDGAPAYVYYAGDITAAYHTTSVDEVGRRMLAVFTGDEEVPMIFLVYDRITSKHESYQKTFLLHMKNEPTIEGNIVTTVNGEGRLVMESLFGAETIVPLGGEGQNFLVNGVQLAPDYNVTDGNWGRVEVRANTDSTSDEMLHLLYVTDAGETITYRAALLETRVYLGTQIGSRVFLFAREQDRSSEVITVTAAGEGTVTYYIAGVNEGSWNISVDGVSCGTATASEAGGFLTFTAPAGTLTLTPGTDVRPLNSGKLYFDTNEGVFAENPPKYYIYGETISLPAPTRENATFLGWYTSEIFEPGTAITAITPEMTGQIKLYARWSAVILDKDYENETVLAENGNSVNGSNGFLYLIKDKPGASFKTEEGKLIWRAGEADPNVSSQLSLYQELAGESTASYILSLALLPGAEAIPSIFRLRATGPNDSVTLFTVDRDGNILLGGGANLVITTLTEEMQTIRISIDFMTGVMSAHTEGGSEFLSTRFSVPAGSKATTTYEWFKTTTYLFNWQGTGSTTPRALVVDDIKIVSGNCFTAARTTGPLYHLNGGTPSTPLVESGEVGQTITLPTLTLSDAVFLGWYTSPDFSGSPITEFTFSDSLIHLYARFTRTFLFEDYESDWTAGVQNTDLTKQGVKYTVKGGSTFETVAEGENTYLLYRPGTGDPNVNYEAPGLKNLLSGETKVTFRLDLKLAEGSISPSMSFRVRGTGTPGYSDVYAIFSTNAQGEVLFGGQSIATLTSDAFTSLSFTVDFETGAITAAVNGVPASVNATLTLPQNGVTSATTTLEWLNTMTTFVFNWYMGAGADNRAICIDNLMICTAE